MYYWIKLSHIVSACIFLTGFLWIFLGKIAEKQTLTSKHFSINTTLPTITWAMVIPFGLYQLLSGFTIISLKHYELSDLWIKVSLLGFIAVIALWFLMLNTKNKKIQFYLMTLGLSVLLTMVFFMANRLS